MNATLSAPPNATDPILVTLETERDQLLAALVDTELYAASRRLDDALTAYLFAAPGKAKAASEALVAADRAIDLAALADPENARRAARLRHLNAQIHQHRNALNLD